MPRCLLLLTVFVPLALSADWINITRPWLDDLPGWIPGTNVYTARCGNLACDPRTGDVYLGLPVINGIWKSIDAGENWTRIDEDTYQGRNFGGNSYQLDPASGGLVFFALHAGYRDEAGERHTLRPGCLLTTDGGETIHTFGAPDSGGKGGKGRHDGFTWGVVDWTEQPPHRFFTKEHHTKPGDLWYSDDAGVSWRPVEMQANAVGMVNGDILLAGAENGIYRSGDAGMSWEKVSDLVVGNRITHRYGDQVFWTAGNAVIVTTDGKNWQTWGSELPGAITFGPYFGRNPREAMVVSRDGFFVTDDAGVTWDKVADYRGFQRAGYAWDPGRGIIYAGGQNAENDYFKLYYRD